MAFASQTENSWHQTEEHGGNDKSPVPVVRAGHGGDAQEDKDEGLAHAAPHLQEVFDGCVRLVWDVGLHVRPHHHATRNEPDREVRSNTAALVKDVKQQINIYIVMSRD